MRASLTALATAVLLAACATPPQEAPSAKAEPAPPPVVKEETPKFKNSTLKYLAKRKIKPQPTRPLNVRSRCSHKDAVGTVTRLNVLVREADVKAFDVEVSMKGRGSCRFSMKDFSQDAKLPQVLLRHKGQPSCTVRMWEQGQEVTIAFNSCPQSCDGKAFDYLWPVIVNARTGRCF